MSGMYACPSCGNIYDCQENDATDAAHPAWWRGHDYGAARTAETLLRVAKEGRMGKFAGAVEDAAVEIERLRYQIYDRDTLLKNENELYRQATVRAAAVELALEGSILRVAELTQECVALRAELEGRLR